MARARKTEEPLIALLVKNKEELKNMLIQREKMGTEIAERQINTKEENQAMWDDFLSWNKYNEELIRQAFNIPDNSYAEEYKYKPGVGVDFFAGQRREKTLQEYVEDNKDHIRFQLKKLRWFYEKIDLLKTETKSTLIEQKQTGIQQLLDLLLKFHRIAQVIRDRYNERETILIKDEYDVQDLLHGLLQIYFNDIRKEEASPSSVGANSRLDFVLRREKIILEIKMTTEKYSIKKLGEDLLVDIGRYKAYPNCNDLVIFIYDKGDYIRNKNGFISDLEKQSTGELKVTVIINPL